MKNTIALDKKTELDFISLSRDLIQMSSDERISFLCKHDDIPVEEKILVLETFIAILEQLEDYETCAGLFNLRNELFTRKAA